MTLNSLKAGFMGFGEINSPRDMIVRKCAAASEALIQLGVTLCRLASRGERYRLHIITGQAKTPRSWDEAGWAPPAPQLPSLEVILDSPVEEFAEKVLCQHNILAYGDVRPALVDLCKLLGIEVI